MSFENEAGEVGKGNYRPASKEVDQGYLAELSLKLNLWGEVQEQDNDV